jgi:predicted nucleic-acid-binding Zn-ribbon protein
MGSIWKKLGYLFRHKCRECGFGEMYRSRKRDRRERLIGILFLPYGCGRCGFREFKYRAVKMVRPAGTQQH